MKKKIYIAMLLAAMAFTGAHAQDNTQLSKEITLEKDIAPLEKKAVKKSELPKVKKPVQSTSRTQLGYSDLTTPIEVPTGIPTLLPYGYRTAHNFSDKRGYLDFGAGTQANFRVDFGYRIFDQDSENLSIWINHNSTWAGKNPTKVIDVAENRNKQKFNDNTLGVDYNRDLGKGTLSLGLLSHIDIYNYYGGWNRYHAFDGMDPNTIELVNSPIDWDTEKQTFFNINLNAGWKSWFTLMDKPLNYNIGLQYGHANHDKPFNELYKHGVHDNWGIINLGGSYNLTDLTTAALGIKGEYLRRGTKSKLNSEYDLFDEAGMITLSPTYTVRGDMYRLQLGFNGHISFSDGAAFRLSPNIRANLALVDGFSVFANALGGKALGYRQGKHFVNYRYDDPLLLYGSVYTPLDAEVGLKVGPFQGLSAKVSLGYAIVKGEPGIIYRVPELDGYAPARGVNIPPTTHYVPRDAWLGLYTGFMSSYNVIDSRGYYLNAELNYKFRSLIEATAAVKYAPHDNEMFASDGHYNGYKMGVDRASTVASLDVKVNPWRPLSVNVGLEYRGGRMALFGDMPYYDEGDNNTSSNYKFVNMDDVINLHAGANYRLNSNIGLWLQAHNLLNRRYDTLYGMGAQRIGFMLGASITF
ncbi:MAG: TonB-dependent receptor [Muribaculaceae bacterium]|nr:TonB-dependent receptor [Muribaculaceae bacterium]